MIIAATIGYWVAAPARGHGICTRALRFLARHALEDLELQRVQLVTDPDNRRVPARRGEGRLSA